MSSVTKSAPVRKKKLNYNINDLQVALKEIEDGKLKIREASKKYNIPRGTLQDRIHGRSKTNSVRLGRNSVLTTKEEECMELWLVNLAKCGFPLKRNDLQNTVQNIIKEDQRPTPFVDQRPGRRWCEAFLKRHPVLNERIPEGITKARAIVTEEYIRKWFRELKAYLNNINAADILEDPTRILNGDETSFSLCPKTGKVIAPKGWKNCYEIKPGSEKETITVLLVFSAVGETVVPMVVFPYVRPPKEVIDSIPPNWFLGRSESGWMKSDIFFEYVANGVNNWLIEKEIKKPVLLLVDGHKSHLTMALSEFCDSNGIILYALPANTTHILQPADVSVFRPLKVEWRKTVKEWQRKEENFNRSLTKATFCPLLEQVLEKDMTQSIKNGFRKCGLYPFNPDAVDFTKCVMNTIENFEKDSIGQGDIDITIKVLESFKKSFSENGIDINQIINIIKESAANEIDNINDTVLEQRTALNELDINIPTTLQRHAQENITDCNTIENYIVDSEGILLREPERNDFSLSESLLKNIDVASDFSFSLLENPTRPASAASSTSTKSYQIRSGSNTPTNRGGVSPYFRKHLFTPKSLIFSKKRTKENLPSAISAQSWRDIMVQKNKAKQELDKKKQERQNKLKLLREEKAKKKEELIRKRAETAAKKTKQIKKSKKLMKEPPSATQSHIKCVGCEEDLISDVEDDDLKNIGCDKCPRWFHLKCTVHRGRLYSEVAKEDFICHVCYV